MTQYFDAIFVCVLKYFIFVLINICIEALQNLIEGCDLLFFPVVFFVFY